MWVVATLAGLAVFIALVLCVPLDIEPRLDVYGRPKFQMRLVWLFGLVSKEVGKGKKKPAEKKRVVTEAKPKRKRKRIRAETIFKIMRTKGLLKQFKNLLRDILGRLKIRDLAVDFRVGLDNPADTGLLFALIGPTAFFLDSSRVHQIKVEPSFGDGAVCEGYLHGAVRLWPVQLVVPFLRFVFSLATIRVVKILVVSKWKRKK